MEAPPTAAAEDGNTPQLAGAVQEAMDGQQGAGTMAPNGEADREKGNGGGGRLAQGGAKPAVDSQAAVASSPQGLGLGVSEEGVAGRSSPGAGVAVTLKGTAATLFKLVELRDRRYLFRLYRRCIVGRQAVQALLQARIVETRLEGVHVCHAMVMSGLLHPVNDSLLFKDAWTFYRWSPDIDPDSQCQRWTAEGDSEFLANQGSPSTMSPVPGFDPPLVPASGGNRAGDTEAGPGPPAVQPDGAASDGRSTPSLFRVSPTPSLEAGGNSAPEEDDAAPGAAEGDLSRSISLSSISSSSSSSSSLSAAGLSSRGGQGAPANRKWEPDAPSEASGKTESGANGCKPGPALGPLVPMEFTEMADRIHFCGPLATLEGLEREVVALMALPLSACQAALTGGRFVGLSPEGDTLWSVVPHAVSAVELYRPRYGFQVHHSNPDVQQPLFCVSSTASARLRWMSSIQAQISLPFLWGTAPGPVPFDDFGHRLLVEDAHPLRIGRFGPVFPGTLDGAEVSVTLLSQRSPSSVELVAEAAIMNRLRHPCLTRLFGLTTTPEGVMMVCERFHGSLRTLLSGKPDEIRRNPAAFSGIALTLASGLAYLHAQGLTHGTLSPDVVLVDPSSWSVRIGEFGLGAGRPFACSCGAEEELPGTSAANGQAVTAPESVLSPSQTVAAVIHRCTNAAGSDLAEDDVGAGAIAVSPYQAPESIPPLQHPFPTATDDLYSYGVILWEMYSAETPFAHVQEDNLAERVKAGERPHIDEACPVLLTSILKHCWHADPDRRCSLDAVSSLLACRAPLLDDGKGLQEWLAASPLLHAVTAVAYGGWAVHAPLRDILLTHITALLGSHSLLDDLPQMTRAGGVAPAPAEHGGSGSSRIGSWAYDLSPYQPRTGKGRRVAGGITRVPRLQRTLLWSLCGCLKTTAKRDWDQPRLCLLVALCSRLALRHEPECSPSLLRWLAVESLAEIMSRHADEGAIQLHCVAALSTIAHHTPPAASRAFEYVAVAMAGALLRHLDDAGFLAEAVPLMLRLSTSMGERMRDTLRKVHVYMLCEAAMDQLEGPAKEMCAQVLDALDPPLPQASTASGAEPGDGSGVAVGAGRPACKSASDTAGPRDGGNAPTANAGGPEAPEVFEAPYCVNSLVVRGETSDSPKPCFAIGHTHGFLVCAPKALRHLGPDVTLTSVALVDVISDRYTVVVFAAEPGPAMAAAPSHQSTLWVWDGDANQFVQSVDFGSPILWLKVLLGGIAVALADCIIILLGDVASMRDWLCGCTNVLPPRQVIRTLHSDYSMPYDAVCPDTRSPLLVAHASQGKVSLHQVGLGDKVVTRMMPQVGVYTAVRLSPDGSRLATASAHGVHVTVYDCDSGKVSNTLFRGSSDADIVSLAFSGDNAWLAAVREQGGASEKVHVFSLAEADAARYRQGVLSTLRAGKRRRATRSAVTISLEDVCGSRLVFSKGNLLLVGLERGHPERVIVQEYALSVGGSPANAPGGKEQDPAGAGSKDAGDGKRPGEPNDAKDTKDANDLKDAKDARDAAGDKDGRAVTFSRVFQSKVLVV